MDGLSLLLISGMDGATTYLILMTSRVTAGAYVAPSIDPQRDMCWLAGAERLSRWGLSNTVFHVVCKFIYLHVVRMRTNDDDTLRDGQKSCGRPAFMELDSDV